MSNENPIDPQVVSIAEQIVQNEGNAKEGEVRRLAIAMRALANKFGEESLSPQALEALRYCERVLGLNGNS